VTQTLQNPVHLAIKGNEVWVTDRRLRSIFVFDLEGKFLRKFEPSNQQQPPDWTPLALGFAKDGALRATDVGMTDLHRSTFLLRRRKPDGHYRPYRPGRQSHR